jgi:hypothetical protein
VFSYCSPSNLYYWLRSLEELSKEVLCVVDGGWDLVGRENELDIKVFYYYIVRLCINEVKVWLEMRLGVRRRRRNEEYDHAQANEWKVCLSDFLLLLLRLI